MNIVSPAAAKSVKAPPPTKAEFLNKNKETPPSPLRLKNPVRIVTAASLFDGHDVAINIMRRIIQASGAEVIHLGHNHSVQDIVDAAIQEDVQAVAITSYQGGHMEFFKYMYDSFQEKNAGHIQIFGGGGGTILPKEIEELHAYGITRIYSPDDGRKLGLQGMIDDMLRRVDKPLPVPALPSIKKLSQAKDVELSRYISCIENDLKDFQTYRKSLKTGNENKDALVLGLTGTGGAGKSSIVDELIQRYVRDFPKKRIAILCVDPSRQKTGGALLGDRIRMNSIYVEQVYMRSLATRRAHAALPSQIDDILNLFKLARFDLIVLESSGIGQSDTEIVNHADILMYAMTPEYGAATQLEKINMLDYADLVIINKAERRGAQDALRDVKKQYIRNHHPVEEDVKIPVYATIASQFNDSGLNNLYQHLLLLLPGEEGNKKKGPVKKKDLPPSATQSIHRILSPNKIRYLSEIAETVREYNTHARSQSELAQDCYVLNKSLSLLSKPEEKAPLEKILKEKKARLSPENWEKINTWEKQKKAYQEPFFSYLVRNKKIQVPTHSTSLSQIQIPKICVPNYEGWGDILAWQLQENFPGEYPYTAGVFPFKRTQEDPTRMFAGEGGPERTNKRFHYLSQEVSFARLSTAFDSVTLYGEDPHTRPDIYGKIGNAGVSVSTLQATKKLYSGFDLCHPQTSVSMTINGPAATLCAFFMNAAIDQACEKYIREEGLEEDVRKKIKKIYQGQQIPEYKGELPKTHNQLGLMLLGISGDQVLPQEIYQRIKSQTLQTVRGTVQADILKEDQAQNTCIFSTEFSLRLMGDVQQYFINQGIKNFYSVSISGYHIAEAGANPITQLAFTLANGFTYVEYYRSRGMDVNDFVPHLSFFFSNGIDPEYAVIGRVARRIWAKALRERYGGNDRAQKLKYHIQTSGRSLHAQEISFNDIRTTLQALMAVYDNCNSLHTNAYDEAITTPTEESVRRAMAIQLVINKELGTAKNENPLQGSFLIEELTNLVEEAVLSELERISDRGGVLGAMETMYQRNKIQEESLYYEKLKNSGEYPIIGVNTFLSSEGSPTLIPEEVIRATEDEKKDQIQELHDFQSFHKEKASIYLEKLQTTTYQGGNIYEELMESVKYCSLGQITHALYRLGGRYRRSM
ncbi:MAG: methylmalonyl-CoA mutase family protein [Cytophagales bacterium]|nr:methylmalonyl-CoA mutase family protein [Cytophagales bacterium]